MTRRPFLATLSLAVLAGCAPAGLAPRLEAVATRPQRDLVATLTTDALPGATDLLLDAQDRPYVVDGSGVRDLAGRVAFPQPRPQERGHLYAALTADGSLVALGIPNRLQRLAPDGRVLAEHPAPCLDARFGGDLALNARGEAIFPLGCGYDGPTPTPRAWIAQAGPDGTVRVLAGDPDAPAGFADGTGAAARFSRPTAVTLDAFGNVYVVDRGNRAVRRITPGGDVTTVWRDVDAVAITATRSGDLFVGTVDS